MLARLVMRVLSWTLLFGCSENHESGGSDVKPVGEWAKSGETDNYAYYADYASIRKADETVAMVDLFDDKNPQADGGTPARSKATLREYDCQAKKSQALRSTRYTEHMGTRIRKGNERDHWIVFAGRGRVQQRVQAAGSGLLNCHHKRHNRQGPQC